MSDKLDSFKGKLDHASYSMGELHNEDLTGTRQSHSNKKSFNSRGQRSGEYEERGQRNND